MPTYEKFKYEKIKPPSIQDRMDLRRADVLPQTTVPDFIMKIQDKENFLFQVYTKKSMKKIKFKVGVEAYYNRQGQFQIDELIVYEQKNGDEPEKQSDDFEAQRIIQAKNIRGCAGELLKILSMASELNDRSWDPIVMQIAPVIAFLELKNKLYDIGFRTATRTSLVSSHYYPVQLYYETVSQNVEGQQIFVEITADITKVQNIISIDDWKLQRSITKSFIFVAELNKNFNSPISDKIQSYPQLTVKKIYDELDYEWLKEIQKKYGENLRYEQYVMPDVYNEFICRFQTYLKIDQQLLKSVITQIEVICLDRKEPKVSHPDDFPEKLQQAMLKGQYVR